MVWAGEGWGRLFGGVFFEKVAETFFGAEEDEDVTLGEGFAEADDAEGAAVDLGVAGFEQLFERAGLLALDGHEADIVFFEVLGGLGEVAADEGSGDVGLDDGVAAAHVETVDDATHEQRVGEAAGGDLFGNDETVHLHEPQQAGVHGREHAADDAFGAELLGFHGHGHGTLEVVADGDNDGVHLMNGEAGERGGVGEVHDDGGADLVFDEGDVFFATVDGEDLGAELGEVKGEVFAEDAEADDAAFYGEEKGTGFR